MKTPTRNDGFSLIEVLIAVLVLSIGLLGLASLQSTTVRFNHDAYLRSQATSLAYDMADRMRANRDEALAGTYDLDTFPAGPAACGTIAGADVAARDLSAWQSALSCALPVGIGRILRTGSTVTIGVSWDETRGEGDPELFEMTTGL